MKLFEEYVPKTFYTKWSNIEKLVFNFYLSHFGEEVNQLVNEMNFTFPQRVYKPTMIKRAIEHLKPKMDNSELKLWEFERIAYHYTKLVCIQKRHIWRNVQKNCMKNRLTKVISEQFYHIVSIIMRLLVFWYVKPNKQKMVNYRVLRLTQCTVNMIFYMGNIEANALDLSDPVLSAIWKASQQFIRLFRYVLEKKILNLDISQLQLTNKEILPLLSQCQIDDMYEPLLTLDTIVRICLRITPYRNEQSSFHAIQRFFRTEIPSLEIAPLKKRIRRNSINFEKNQKKQYKLDGSEIYFLKISIHQQMLIQNSKTSILLLPLLQKMQQVIGNKEQDDFSDY